MKKIHRIIVLIEGDLEMLQKLKTLTAFNEASVNNQFFESICKREQIITKEFVQAELKRAKLDRIELFLSYLITNDEAKPSEAKPSISPITFQLKSWSAFYNLKEQWNKAKRNIKRNCSEADLITPWYFSPYDEGTGESQCPIIYSSDEPRTVIVTFRDKTAHKRTKKPSAE